MYWMSSCGLNIIRAIFKIHQSLHFRNIFLRDSCVTPPSWLHTDVNPCLRLCTNGDQQYRSGERSIRTDSPRPEYPSRFTLGDNHTRSVNYVPTSISVPMRRSCTNSIDGLCLGSAFQQSHINDHRRSVISDDSGRLGRTPLITSKITVGSCFLFEKGFVPV